MIELRNDTLVFSFPEVHPGARMTITFQRTLRIPDDESEYPLPPGLGPFPLRHVDDFAEAVPPSWVEHGGVLLPMYQSEALWLQFEPDYVSPRETCYPFVVKVGTGKRSAITGQAWRDGLHRDPQDYLVVPKQPWLDGYCVQEGVVRQFVAMPLGSGYTAEEQLTGHAEHGGIQLTVHPMRRDVFERRFPVVERSPARHFMRMGEMEFISSSLPCGEMGLAPGGRMRQQIFDDPFRLADWDREHRARCFVHIANSLAWRAITGEQPPTTPFTAKEYTRAGLPWFEYYDDKATTLRGSDELHRMQSVAAMSREKGGTPLADNEPVRPGNVLRLRASLPPEQVREGSF